MLRGPACQFRSRSVKTEDRRWLNLICYQVEIKYGVRGVDGNRRARRASARSGRRSAGQRGDAGEQPASERKGAAMEERACVRCSYIPSRAPLA